MPIINSIAANAEEMTAWRRDFHANPETAYNEVRTAKTVAEKLASWGIEVHQGIGKTGVVGVLKGRTDSGRAIGLRADMDALPMEEANSFDHKSRNPGAFHGCGHDGHTTMLLGAAQYLAETRNFDGTVHFIFQPAEEGGGGGDAMIKDGLFERFNCDEVYGMHNWPSLPLGHASVEAGPVMAATDTFTIDLAVEGGHAAMPHMATDVIVIASHLVTQFQGLISRGTDPLESAVLSVTQFHAGSAFNVLPGTAQLCGTIRTFKRDVRNRVTDGMKRLAEAAMVAYGGTIAVNIIDGYPPTVNHERECGLAQDVLKRVLGDDRITPVPPVMGGEDFSYMLEERPGAYMVLGTGEPDREDFALHNPRYDFNDNLLPIGASVYASMVEDRLRAA